VATRPDWQALPGEATVSLWHETQPQGGDFAIQLGTIDYVLYGLPGETADKAVTIGHWFDDSGSRGPARNVSAETAPDRWVLARKEPKAGFRLTTTDSLVLREAIRAGMGPALLPVALGDPDLDLVRVPPGRVAVRRPVMLHAHPDTVELGRVQAVIALLRRHFDAIFEAAAPHGVEPTEAGGSKGAVPLRGRRRP
jgi:DNA-binding transcriptional LysR family regulator